MGLRIRLLGPMTITNGGRPVAIASKRARALIGYMALREGAEIGRSVITGLLWGERSDGQARASLRQTLSELRGTLEGSAQHSIVATKDTVSWVAGSAWIDTKVVEASVDSGNENELREAAELVGGELMEGLAVSEAGFEQWLAGERERFRLLVGRIYTRLMEGAEYSGRMEEALTYGLKLLSLDPLQEHVHRALMRLYTAQGRYDAALSQYERCRRELSTQLGVPPASETEDLARSIRASRRDGPAKDREGVLPLPDKPSIAVLPFQNMSGDPEQEYFADGIVEEIITALSRVRWLFVIARNSSFIYKGRAVDVRQIGREQGVRYVLEGSVRKAGYRIRIAGQLVDASTGMQLWADRFDGEIKDVFGLQDQVTASVVGAIAPKLEQAEIERVKRKPTESLDAYDHYLRGMAGLHQWTREGNKEGLSHFYRAIELDPNFASAYGMAARCYSQRRTSGWTTDFAQEVTETVRLARRATELGREDADALSAAGFSLAYVAGEADEGAVLIERALALNPNLAWAWYFSGWVKLYLGEPEAAIAHTARAMRLSPHDIHIFNMQTVVAYAHLVTGRFDHAIIWAEMALRERSNHVSALRVLAASCALSGRPEQARKAMVLLRELNPALQLSNLSEYIPLRRAEDFSLLAEGLRQAGLPE
jgi:TolB-like protein